MSDKSELLAAVASALDQLIRQCDIDEGEDLAWLVMEHPKWREESGMELYEETDRT